jgi:hypothetical protein
VSLDGVKGFKGRSKSPDEEGTETVDTHWSEDVYSGRSKSPDEEGTETTARAPWRRTDRPVAARAPMKRGLKPALADSPTELRQGRSKSPDEEGSPRGCVVSTIEIKGSDPGFPAEAPTSAHYA